MLENIALTYENPTLISSEADFVNAESSCTSQVITEAIEGFYESLEQIITRLLTWQDAQSAQGSAGEFSSFLREKCDHIMEAHAMIASEHSDLAQYLHDSLHLTHEATAPSVLCVVLESIPPLLQFGLVGYLNIFTRDIRLAYEKKASRLSDKACAEVHREIVEQFHSNTSCTFEDAVNPFIENLKTSCATAEDLKKRIRLALNYEDDCPCGYEDIHREMGKVYPQIELLRDNVKYADRGPGSDFAKLVEEKYAKDKRADDYSSDEAPAIQAGPVVAHEFWLIRILRAVLQWLGY